MGVTTLQEQLKRLCRELPRNGRCPNLRVLRFPAKKQVSKNTQQFLIHTSSNGRRLLVKGTTHTVELLLISRQSPREDSLLTKSLNSLGNTSYRGANPPNHLIEIWHSRHYAPQNQLLLYKACLLTLVSSLKSINSPPNTRSTRIGPSCLGHNPHLSSRYLKKNQPTPKSFLLLPKPPPPFNQQHSILVFQATNKAPHWV